MRYPQGMFGWADLSTSDQAAATAFYTKLFGWEAEEVPTDRGTIHVMLRKDGKLVAGLGPQPDDQQEAGVPPSWTNFVMVGDADEIVAAATSAGGRVLWPAFDVMDQGRSAIISDPSGAVLGVWQPRTHDGADVFGVPGAVSWVELQSRDLSAATAFYEEVFGWRWELSHSGDSDYLVGYTEGPTKPGMNADDPASAGGTMNAGAMPMPPDVPPEVPSMWGVYFTVTDIDDAVARATRLGAAVVVPAMDMDGGRFAALTDPQGAYFSVISTMNAAEEVSAAGA
jgi:predicted enzyme related to lactoylglutathione lyase